MKKTKYILLALLVIIILIFSGIIIYFSINQPQEWYCSPKGMRGGQPDYLQKAISPAQPLEKFDDELLNKYIITEDANSYQIKPPSENPPENSYPFELYEMNPGESLKMGDGNVRLVSMGAAFLDVNNMMQNEFDFNLYDSNYNVMSVNDIDRKGLYRPVEYVSNIRYDEPVSVRLEFQYNNVEDIKFHSISIFDANTHKSLTSGSSWTGNENSCRFNAEIPLWYRTPVDVVFDISYGPSQTYEFQPKAGEGFENEYFKCQLLDVFKSVDASQYGSTQFNKTTKDPGSAFYFVCQPTTDKIPVTFEFIADDGSKVNGGSSNGGHRYITILRQPLEKITLIRAKYRTNRYRVMIHFPYIPGLPVQNANIDNIFDVYIPYVIFNNKQEMESFLKNTLQLNQIIATGTPRKKSIGDVKFPLEFRATTLRDIAKVYAAGGNLNVDIENNRLELKYPVPFLTKMKQLFKKMLNK
jgi:hypothetical protein